MQYRQGHNIIIAKTGSDLCPASWVNKYIAVANLIPESDQFLFSPVKYIKSSDSYILSEAKLSYTRAREIFHEAIEAIGQDKNLFYLHSLRSGGCSAATNSEVEERLVMADGKEFLLKMVMLKMSLVNEFLFKRNWEFNFSSTSLFSR